LGTGVLEGPRWELGGGLLSPRTLTDRRRRLCKQGISIYGSSARGTWREGYLLGTLKDV